MCKRFHTLSPIPSNFIIKMRILKVNFYQKRVDKSARCDIFCPMNDKIRKNSQIRTNQDQCGALFLSFCRALDKYCDQIGVNNRRGGAARILHDAACNTVTGMNSVTAAQRRHMARMERDIPQMFAGLIAIYSKDGLINTIERMSTMSLAQISAIISQNRRGR